MLSAGVRSFLKEKALVPHHPGQDLILKEKGVMKVAVSEIPADVTAARMHVVGHLPGVRDGDWKQICDFVLFRKCEDVDRAVLIELKTTLNESNKRKAMAQLRGSLPILEYLRSMCLLHQGPSAKLPALQVSYFLIAAKRDARIDKQSVRPQTGSGRETYGDIEVHTLLGERVGFGLLLDG